MNKFLLSFKLTFITPISLKTVFNNTIFGKGYIWYQNLAILIISFFSTSIKFFSWGHIIIGLVKLCGFNVPNNTQSPFLATNIADFFNRYYFYFKEMLVNIFFYPTFFNFNFLSFKMKLFLSTFMAAFLGNFLYHYFKYPIKILKYGIYNSIIHTSSFAAYSLFLTLGIFLSQISKKNNQQYSSPIIIWSKRIGVWTFFLLLHPFYYFYYSFYSLKQYFKFFFSLFNLL